MRQTQQDQSAQVGYGCDYQNKSEHISVHESKEWMLSLREEIKDKKPGYVAARTAKRVITDCYGKGVVRGAVETAALIENSGHSDPTRAESIKTAPTQEISTLHPLQSLEAIRAGREWPIEPRRAQVDKRNFADRKVQDCPPWTLYGARGKDPAVHALSAYELAQHFYLKQARHPLNQKLQARHSDPDKFHAALTEEGLQKLGRGIKSLQPLVDYKIKEEGGASWRPLGRGQHAAGYRHDWVLERKRCPFVPVVQGAQGGRTQEEQAMRILVLFFPCMGERPLRSYAAGPLHRRFLAGGLRRLVSSAALPRQQLRLSHAGSEDPGAELRLRLLHAPGGVRGRRRALR